MAKEKKSSLDIQGDISIHSENIFPIIKKWLYSDHEIFVRELTSNAQDAITKLEKIALRDGKEALQRDGKIAVVIDESAKTITISDNGLGMTADEVQKYINQIAFSGAEDFVENFKDKDEKNQIIGHFGMGFYSAFMVADLVEIKSLSYQDKADAIHWSCDGSTQFSITSSDRKEVGTDIILHINDDNKDFLSTERIKSLIHKYANFFPAEISLNGDAINDRAALWTKAPGDVSDEDYGDFYKKLYPFQADPLFWIHLNVDYPFNLKGILYFPKVMHELDAKKGQIKLFCQNVFVTDHASEVVPEFLTLLQGGIDCPDIPLNVSRSQLQNDPYVQKISKHIVKKVADKLNELFKNDRENFETYWEDIHPFIKYGMMNNDDFYAKVKDIVIFKSSTGNSTSIPDYLDRNKSRHENVVLYCSDQEGQATYVNMAKTEGLELIFVPTIIDSHFLSFLESKDSTVKYKAIDSELSEFLKDSDPKAEDDKGADTADIDDKIEALFKAQLKKDDLKIQVQGLKNKTVSAIILESEQGKRMKQMAAMMQGSSSFPTFNDYTLVVNKNSDVIQRILDLQADDKKSDMVSLLTKHVYDLAVMAHKPLTGDAIESFVQRENELLSRMTKWGEK